MVGTSLGIGVDRWTADTCNQGYETEKRLLALISRLLQRLAWRLATQGGQHALDER
jgi:hypothetical protein